MLKQLRYEVTRHLWENAKQLSPDLQLIEQKLAEKGSCRLFLDHFALIDLPGPYSGIPFLSKIFNMLGYQEKGKDYLPSKQNAFIWMTEPDSDTLRASEALPQVVLADFRLDELPANIKDIIAKYAAQTPPFSFSSLNASLAEMQNPQQCEVLGKQLASYLTSRHWPLPTVREFQTVQAFNELLAWTLACGRRPNHFTLSIHLLEKFTDLLEFNKFIENEVKLTLNSEGGIIKGAKDKGIMQSSTQGITQRLQLANGSIDIPIEFIEFVWRYPVITHRKPILWKDFYTGFIATQANHVIESLYL